jgi:hypothetical protein
MKITKQRLKEIIKEELSQAGDRTALDDAAGLLYNLIDRLQHESGVGRPVVVSSRAGEDIDVLEELLKIQEFIQEHRTPALELPSLGYDADRGTFASPEQQRIARRRAGDK